jgi:predicted N-acetyltransferase YhbS
LGNRFTVRPYRPSDDEGIVSLLEEVFNGWPRIDINDSELEYWRWKFDKKDLPRKLITVAVKDCKIIGALQSIPLNVKVKEKIVSSCLGADAAVHPEHRRQGVRNRIARAHIADAREYTRAINLALYATLVPWQIRLLSHTR